MGVHPIINLIYHGGCPEERTLITSLGLRSLLREKALIQLSLEVLAFELFIVHLEVL